MQATLPYSPDSAPLFEAIADLPWAAFLDSGRPFSERGRYDILTADPELTIVTKEHATQIHHGRDVRISFADPFDVLRHYLGQVETRPDDMPFRGGALGYFAYDLGRKLEGVQAEGVQEQATSTPLLAVGIYDWALVVDHREQRTELVSYGRSPRTALKWKELISRFLRTPQNKCDTGFRLLREPCSDTSYQDYARSFRKIQNYIREGDCYQVNLAQRFHLDVEGSVWHAYRTLRELNPAPYAAFLNLPFGQVLSLSPEQFLSHKDGRVQTRPIKGTRPRSADKTDDARLARELADSRKDQAENLMIVDLLRNDLGKVCTPGTISVPQLFEVQSFPAVHHLVSTIMGDLAPERDCLDLLKACFPGGSITGAPKRRAMEIIQELEPNPRGVYCGSVGYIGYDHVVDTNIAIRTMVHRNGTLHLWAGGGIVADSQLEMEYQETFDKVAVILRALSQAGKMNVDREARR